MPRPPDPRAALGRRGERAAAWFLRLRGYRILGRNLRFPHGEIDIVARRGGIVAFVEVRTRATADPIPPSRPSPPRNSGTSGPPRGSTWPATPTPR